MPHTCRAVYPKVSQVGARLVEILHSTAQDEAVDMSEVCMCETIDALGLAGFDKAFHSIEAIRQGQRAHLLDVSGSYTRHLQPHWHLFPPCCHPMICSLVAAHCQLCLSQLVLCTGGPARPSSMTESDGQLINLTVT